MAAGSGSAPGAGKHDHLDGRPAVVTLLGNGLSRARGGPRCMTMPLEWDPLYRIRALAARRSIECC